MVRQFVAALFLTASGGLGWTQTSQAPSSPVPAVDSTGGVVPKQPLNSTNRAEQVRNACIEGRRFICGRVLQVTPAGLVVDSGYKQLLSPPFDRSWVVSGTASLVRSPNALEDKRPDAVCVGLVFLANTPKKPAVKEYDYVVLHGYPAGEHLYIPVPGVAKTIRRFSASLERAVEWNLNLSQTNPASPTKGPATLR